MNITHSGNHYEPDSLSLSLNVYRHRFGQGACSNGETGSTRQWPRIWLKRNVAYKRHEGLLLGHARAKVIITVNRKETLANHTYFHLFCQHLTFKDCKALGFIIELATLASITSL